MQGRIIMYDTFPAAELQIKLTERLNIEGLLLE